MELIADFLMAAGAFGAAIYCYVLSNRLKRFTALETGMGGAIAVLSVQVDDMTRVLESARSAAQSQSDGLRGQTAKAEAVAAQLELLVAAMHDLPRAEQSEDEDTDKRLRFVRRRGAAIEMEAAE
jgi:high-affinity Fe2+/Pb2+ permease